MTDSGTLNDRKIRAIVKQANREKAKIAAARSIQAAFAQNPGASVLALEGRMLERLHAEEAARILALAEAIQGK